MSNSTALYSQCTTTYTSLRHETQTAAVTRIQTYIHSAAQIPNQSKKQQIVSDLWVGAFCAGTAVLAYSQGDNSRSETFAK